MLWAPSSIHAETAFPTNFPRCLTFIVSAAICNRDGRTFGYPGVAIPAAVRPARMEACIGIGSRAAGQRWKGLSEIVGWRLLQRDNHRKRHLTRGRTRFELR